MIHADICSNCHPFYTGKQKILDTGGRVARFERRFGKKQPDEQVDPHHPVGVRGYTHRVRHAWIRSAGAQ